MILSLGKQRIRLIRPQNADARRPSDQLRVGPDMVVAQRALRVVDRIGEVQRKVSAHNGQLARVPGPIGCFHQNSLYQLHN